MKNKSLLVASALAAMLLSSCAKSIVLSDGEKTKRIWVDGKIIYHKDGENATLSFESVNGTNYTIDANKYTYVIK